MPKDIVGAIANEAGIDSKYIGHIKLFEEFSIVDLPADMPADVFQHLKKVRVREHRLNICLDKGPRERAAGDQAEPSRRREQRPDAKSQSRPETGRNNIDKPGPKKARTGGPIKGKPNNGVKKPKIRDKNA